MEVDVTKLDQLVDKAGADLQNHRGRGFLLVSLLLAAPGLMSPPSAPVPWLLFYGGIHGITLTYLREKRSSLGLQRKSKTPEERDE